MFFCDRIIVPASCHISVTYCNRDNSLPSIRSLSPYLTILRSVLPLCNRVELFLDTEWILFISASVDQPERNRTPIIPDMTRPRISLGVETDDPLPQDTSLTLETWMALFRPFSGPESIVSTLRLMYNEIEDMPLELWNAGLACFPRLEELMVGHTFARDTSPMLNGQKLARLFAVLAGEGEAETSGETGLDEALAPKLCAPCLRRIAWSTVAIDQAFVDGVAQMLEARSARGTPPGRMLEIDIVDAVLMSGVDLDESKARLERLACLSIK